MKLSKFLYEDRRNPIKSQGSVPLEKIVLGLATMTRLEARFWAEESNTQRKNVFTEQEPSHVYEETSRDQGPEKERPINMRDQEKEGPQI